MKTLSLDIIKKIWKRKLTKDFKSGKEQFNVYVDSPFCAAPLCKFCCFEPNIISDKRMMEIKEEYYNKTLLENIDEFGEVLGLRTPDTIYFGGGSSSLMSLSQMKRVFERLGQYFDLKDGVKEKTFEMNPNQVTDEKLALLSEWNFTHVTMGVQSFDEGVLKHNRRINPSLEKLKGIFGRFEERKFEYNMDLMVFVYKGNTEQDLEILKKDVEMVTRELKPNRITVFPNYKQLLELDNPLIDAEENKKQVFEKIRKLREVVRGFENEEYGVSPTPIPVTLNNHRINYYITNKNKFSKITYNCSCWLNRDARLLITNQNVLALGSYGGRKTYSYIGKDFCYNTVNDENGRRYELVYADIKY